MPLKNDQAAQLLEGRVLQGGWHAVEKIAPAAHQTGGVYSSYYKVENGDRKGFLKAFDYSAAARATNDFATEINNITTAYNLERDILELCKENGCRNIIQILDKGFIDVPEAGQYPRVEYLILEYAEKGNLRDVLSNNDVTLEWKIRSLHQMAKGLSELHKLSIAHQDVKPSNIVQLSSGQTKISDLGSAAPINGDQRRLPQRQLNHLSGTWEYAPPELLYGSIASDDNVRRIGCDLYLLGSMIAFYFTNMSMTALIKNNLSASLCWTIPTNYGNYDSFKAYVIEAFEKAIADIAFQIENQYLRDKVVETVRYLCHPDPLVRGHEKNIARRGSNYSLERFISSFDLIARKLKLKKL